MKEEKITTVKKTAGRREDPVETVMNELLDRHPHLRAAREAMRGDGVVCNQFAQDALSVFRQRFEN